MSHQVVWILVTSTLSCIQPILSLVTSLNSLSVLHPWSDFIHLMCGLPLFRLPSPISIIGFSNLSLSTHPWGARNMAASFLQLVMRKPDWLLQGQTGLFSWTTTPAPHLVAVNSFPFTLFDGPWLAYIHYYWLPYSKQSMTITLVLVINYKLRNYNWTQHCHTHSTHTYHTHTLHTDTHHTHTLRTHTTHTLHARILTYTTHTLTHTMYTACTHTLTLPYTQPCPPTPHNPAPHNPLPTLPHPPASTHIHTTPHTHTLAHTTHTHWDIPHTHSTFTHTCTHTDIHHTRTPTRPPARTHARTHTHTHTHTPCTCWWLDLHLMNIFISDSFRKNRTYSLNIQITINVSSMYKLRRILTNIASSQEQFRNGTIHMTKWSAEASVQQVHDLSEWPISASIHRVVLS